MTPDHWRASRPANRRGTALLLHRFCGGGRYVLAHVATAAGFDIPAEIPPSRSG
jgi:hypothetical protein